MPDIPAGTSTTTNLSIGGSISDVLEIGGDRDWIRVTLTAGQSYRFDLVGSGATPVGDPYLYLRDASGNVLTGDDDSGGNFNSRITFTAATSGTYYLDAGAYNGNYTGGYTLSAAIVQPLPVYSNSQIANYLTTGFWTDTGRAQHAFASTTISYNIEALTAAGQTLAINAFTAWSAVSGLTFVRTTGSGNITFDDNQSGAFASYVATGNTTTSATVNVSTDWLSDYGTGVNSYSFQTYIHEIGHALGLGHAGNYNGSAGWSASPGGDNHFLNDSWQATIMSYFDQDENTWVNASRAFVIGPMMADITAIQSLYGVPTNANSGATTYGFNSTAVGYFNFNQFTEGNMIAFTIYDSGGTDMLDASGFTGAQMIDLRSGQYSNIGGEVGNIGIAVNAVIENATGGSGNDVITGNDVVNFLFGRNGNDDLNSLGGDDHLWGGAGADRHIGGAGIDYARYDDANWGNLVIRLDNSALNTGVAAGDTYFEIEGLVGGAGDDTIYGNGAANYLFGQGGNDLIVGGDGADSLYGGDGSDNLVGGLGADRHDGGAGIDYARYDDANYGNLVIRLDNSSLNTGAAAGDTYIGIEGLVGGLGNDTIYGDALRNILFGEGGNDSIFGGGGNDGLYGGDGSDNLWGGEGADNLDGGAGIDYARYDDANYGNLVIRLDTPSLNTGAAAGDTYIGIEGLVGGVGNDTIYGDGLANFLFGQGGNDSIYGGNGNDSIYGGDGADQLYGGDGDDLLFGGLGADSLNGGAGFDYVRYDDVDYGSLTIRLDAPWLNTGAAAGDTYTDIEAVVGGVGGDTIYGNASNNSLYGGGGGDLLLGGAGNDTLYGGDGSDNLIGEAGNDVLYGGAGSDYFRFLSAPGAENVDSIADFAHGIDRIVLSRSIFAGIGTTLDATEFGSLADPDNFIIYNQGTGQLFYDAAGSTGGAGPVLFATVTAGTVLDVNDFIMIA